MLSCRYILRYDKLSRTKQITHIYNTIDIKRLKIYMITFLIPSFIIYRAFPQIHWPPLWISLFLIIVINGTFQGTLVFRVIL